MDGTARMVLHNTTLRSPYAITVDYQTQTLYWLDYSLDRLESSRTDGSGRSLLTRNSIRSPFDVTFYDGYLYWTDQSYYRLLSTPVRNPNNVTFLTPRRCCNTPYGVQVISEDRQPSGNVVVASCKVLGEMSWVLRTCELHFNLESLYQYGLHYTSCKRCNKV